MLLSFLRHISIRIWIALLLGGLVSLSVLPILQSRLGLASNPFLATAILVLFFWVIGWALNRWALSAVDHLIAEAGAFERDGLYTEAEAAFQRAAAIFDSFMISPFVKRNRAGYLGARLARFYLARSRWDQKSEDFLVSYLKSNPRDGDVAQHWLHQIESGRGLNDEHQELAALIGDAQPKNIVIQSTLARFYLLLERADFPALQTYLRVCNNAKSATPEFLTALAQLFIKEQRADEWALDVYLRALAQDGDRKAYLAGLAACVHWIPPAERNRHLLQSAYRRLKGFDANTLKRMRAGFNPPVPTKPPRKIHRRIKPGALLAGIVQALYHYPGAIIKWTASLIKEAADLIQNSRKIRRALTGILLCGLLLGIGVLVVNTVRHLTATEASHAKVAPPPAKIISDPFTLQVAAYLQAAHAKNYVQQLKKQGVDAYWSEAVRADKRWYQVRVSHFATKQSARDYGAKLKAKGVIEDYYVANYRRP